MVEKPIEMLNDAVTKTAHKFAIKHKVKLLGSNSLRGMLYPSDFDFESKLTDRKKALYTEFKKVFQNKAFMNSIYFMDFKCGIDERFVDINNLPPNLLKQVKSADDPEEAHRDLYILRWKPNDVINGFIKLVDGKKKSFIDCLDDDTILKIDWIVPVGHTFAECSTNYYYKQTPPTEEEIVKGLKEDIEEYKNTNTMKSLKRFYSLLQSLKKEKSTQKKLVSFFNSPIGYINKVKNDLQLLMDLTETHEIEWSKIQSNIQMLKENLSNTEIPQNSVVLDLNCNQRNYRKKVQSVIDKLQKIINEVSKELLREIE
jgi:hypothetical protein